MEKDRDNVQLWIFVAVAFALPLLTGVVMGFAYSRGLDTSVFPSAQMYYPAAGAMLAALVSRNGDALLPKRFFTGFIAMTVLLLFMAVASVIAPDLPWVTISSATMVVSSLAGWLLLLTEKKLKRIAYGLTGGRWKMAAAVVFLYLALYLIRAVAASIIGGVPDALLASAQDPNTWLLVAVLPVNYFLVFAAFFGEEYGWRYFLQPVLQKKFGLTKGVLVLGIMWGLWHLPINFFYYTSPETGFISLTGQLITCVALGLFYGWAYMKTDNIWTVVVLHFLNNNLIPILAGNHSNDVLQNQVIGWSDILVQLALNIPLFCWVVFTAPYRAQSLRLPTMDERAARSAAAAELQPPQE